MEKTYSWELRDLDDTHRFAEQLAGFLQAGDLLALEGNLGAGKTSFTQGLARGLGVRGVVNSPTFTIIKEYMGRLPLYHMDVYRVENDVDDLGLDEYFYGEGVCVVEWASLIEEFLPPERLTVRLSTTEQNTRICRLEPAGERYIQLCEEFDFHASVGD